MKRAKVYLKRYQDDGEDERWWFTVVGRNGRTLVTSETYLQRRGAMNAIAALARLKLEVVDTTRPRK